MSVYCSTCPLGAKPPTVACGRLPPSLGYTRIGGLRRSRPRMAWIDAFPQPDRGAQRVAPHGECGTAQLGLWAEINKQVRRHRLHIVAPPGVEFSKCARLNRLADGKGRLVLRDGNST
jgi:hypothetical protein